MIRPFLLLIGALTFAVGCSTDAPEPGTYVARVGDAFLTEENLAADLPPGYEGQDGGTLRSTLINSWIERQLLLQEAERNGVFERADVQRQIKENTEAIAIGSLVESTIASTPFQPSDADLTRYYNRNRANLVLREPHVRFSAFYGRTEGNAVAAETAARRSPTEPPSWQSIDASTRTMRDTITSVNTLPFETNDLSTALVALAPGGITTVETDGRWVVLVLHERRAAGDLPPMRWVRPEILNRLRIDTRRTALRRLVSSLRDQAVSRRTLEIPASDSTAKGSTPDSLVAEPAISPDTLR